MNALLSRPSNVSLRVFPSIDPDLYDRVARSDDLTPDQRVAQDLLSLVKRDFSPWARFVGRKLDGPGQVARLLLLHKLGMEAELAGRWRKADYFWDLVCGQTQHLATRPDAWQDLVRSIADKPGIRVLDDPERLFQRLVEEIFIDTHCVLYNSQISAEPDVTWQSRAFAHLDRIKQLAKFSTLTKQELADLLCRPLELRLTVCETAQEWDLAIKTCDALLECSPSVERYRDRLAQLHLAGTLAQVKTTKSEKASLRNVKTIQGGIRHLEQMHRQYPYNLAVFETLGHLHHQCAIHLANAGRLADALVSAQKALVHCPGLEQARRTRDKLAQTMLQLQAQMKLVSERLRHQPRARLNARGMRLQSEARQGLLPLERYVESKEARAVAEGFYAAQGRYVWREIGLPEPEDNWDQQGQLLLVGMSKVTKDPPDSPAELAAAWEAVAAEQEELLSLDAKRICSYLQRRLFSTEATQENEKPEYTLDASEDAVVIPQVAVHRRWSLEPLGFWLFSQQDKIVKVLAAVAISLMLIVGVLTVNDYRARGKREAAYREIIAAAERQDDEAVMDNAAIYLTNPLLSGKDGRDEEVTKLYNDAYVRWFASLEGNIDERARERIEQHRALSIP